MGTSGEGKRTSKRSGRAKVSKTRIQDRVASKGTVWMSAAGRFVPVGVLLDLGKRGVRYRHDPTCLDEEGFPFPAPEISQPLMLAVTIRAGDPLKPISAKALRVTCEKDGQVEVACSFEASDAEEMRTLHRKYVDASLQRARNSLSMFQERMLGAEPVKRNKKQLGQILIRRRAIDRKDLEEYRAGNLDGVGLGERLVQAGVLSERQLAEALSEHVGIPFVDLDIVGVDSNAKASIKMASAKKMKVVPFYVGTRRLKIACGRVLSALERSDLEAESKKKVVMHLADAEQISNYLHGISVRKKRRSTQRTQVGVWTRYRFYGSALQTYDQRTFQGVVVNLSETGILLSGPVPEKLEKEFKGGKKPRLIMAVQIFCGKSKKPDLIRFEPVRITEAEFKNEAEGRELAGTAWIGARVSPLASGDQMKIKKLVQRLS